jgi:hypothetical protein
LQPVVDNGVFQIPLYHGTSSVYLESIEKYGLGAVNPIRRDDALALFKNLLAACDEVFANDVEWNSLRFLPQWMSDQRSMSSYVNFQHGETYLTPSRSSAVSYALSNRLGSEFISEADRLYRLLVGRNPRIVAERGLDRHPLIRMFDLNATPVLITIQGVPVKSVATEGGGSPQDSIASLQNFGDLIGRPGCTINVNFRLRVPILPGHFSVEILDPSVEKNVYKW